MIYLMFTWTGSRGERAPALFSRLSAESLSRAAFAVRTGHETRRRDGLRRSVARKSWTNWLATIVLAVACASVHAQPAPSPGSDRVAFAQSIKDVATVPAAALVRSELTETEAKATLEFSVALKMRDFADFEERIGKGEIISFNEMEARYYPTAADYQTVVDWLTSQGFAVKPADKYNLSVFASGSVALVGRAFGTRFGRVSFSGVEYSSALIAPSVSAAIAGPVLAINGLQPHLRPRTHSGIGLGQPQKLIGILPPYTIGEIAKAYNVSRLGGNGTGQKIGIVIDTFPAGSDLTAFWQGNAIAQSLNNIEQVQVVGGPLPSPSGEESLDVEWSSGMASGAKVRIYATTDLAFVHTDQAYQAIINELPSQPALHQISLSYGLGELYESTAQMQTDDQYFAIMAGAGVTVFVSSGDGGSSPGLNGWEDNSGSVQVEAPANDPNVTAVGGTSLYLDGSTGAVTSENAWLYGGGGSSQFFARPSWQTGAGVPTGNFRTVPDVALVADLNTGGYLVLNGQVYLVGGTSWGAPTWAGFCAIINQARANLSQSSIGLLGPKIYPMIGTSNFRDITTGSNGPNGVYNAGPGYDLATGVGVPNMAAIIGTVTTPMAAPTHPGAKDFNGDGYADLVLENSSTGERSIWLLKNGVPSSRINLPTIPVAWHIAGVGDFNGDGYADLVWENSSTGERSIWFLKNGVLSSIVNLPTIPVEWCIAGAGDFNGDGSAGLVLENSSTGEHSIWLLKNGVPSSNINLPTIPVEWHIAGVGDFNGDGYADLVWENSSTGEHSIWFLKNGVLSSTVNLPTIPVEWHIAGAGDFNGDGYADLVWENSSTGERAIWFLKNGVPASNINLPTIPVEWHIADH
jgi:kumamolisin